MTKLRVLMCALALAVPAGAAAQATSPAPSPNKPKSAAPAAKSAPDQPKERQSTKAMSEAEQRTLFDLHKLNQAEIAVGQLAASKAQSTAVKRYAEHLVTDHKATDAKVTALAKRRNAQLDALTPTPKQAEQAKQDQALLQRLKLAQGEQFDNQFVQAMVEGHRKAIEHVQAAKAQCDDPELHGLLNEILPGLSQHLQAAQQLTNERPSPAKP